MKKCTTCNVEKELIEYGRGKISCKECSALYSKKRKSLYGIEYHKKNRERLLLNQKDYYKKNQQQQQQRGIAFYNDNVVIIRKREKDKVAVLSDYYVKETLKRNGYKLKDITPELVEVKRELLKINRLIKQK
tara:strand:- start:237 stop:632 length:396 start_codon:yes stop_codon:yes gene_type:complete